MHGALMTSASMMQDLCGLCSPCFCLTSIICLPTISVSLQELCASDILAAALRKASGFSADGAGILLIIDNAEDPLACADGKSALQDAIGKVGLGPLDCQARMCLWLHGPSRGLK